MSLVTNYDLKKRARDALLDRWPNAILVVLITVLLSLLGQMYDVLTGTNSTQQFLQFVSDLMKGRSLRQALIPFLTGDSASINLFDVAEFIFLPMLGMGCIDYMMRHLQGDHNASVDTILAHKGSFWPALKTSLLTNVRSLGWMLPSFILILVGIAQVDNGNDAGLLLVIIGFAAMLLLGCWVTLRYSMTLYFLTADPQMSSKKCIQASIDMMAHRKLQLFMLDLSFILFDAGILLAQMLLAGVLGSIPAALLGIALHLPVQTYREAAAAAFFLEFRPQTESAPETPEEEKPSLLERWNHGTEL